MDKNILKAFGNQVRRERKKLQLSQEDFASLAGIHRTYIGVVERGEKNITLKNTGLFDTRGNFNYLAALNILVDRDANSIDINVIQCKTNWNDNAQIPMLWDMVYNAQSFKNKKNKNTSQKWTMPVWNWLLTISQLAIFFEGRLDKYLEV